MALLAHTGMNFLRVLEGPGLLMVKAFFALLLLLLLTCVAWLARSFLHPIWGGFERRLNPPLTMGVVDVLVSSGANGRFSISELTRTSAIDIVVVAAGYGGVSRRVIPPEEGVLDNIRIQLKRGDSTLRGTIVDGAGKSVPGAWVIAHDQSYGIKGVRFLIETNGRAEYELPLIAGRKYLIEAYKKGHDFSRVWKEVSMPPGGLTLPPLRLEKEK
ncbi:carboxypeptidase regulatory-like domain-containing protein [Acidimicrobium ferrooxidans]|nr:carboxypeptidase regulatory-like domain-containing protein [Acidimicrobium ferrooxidans]